MKIPFLFILSMWFQISYCQSDFVDKGLRGLEFDYVHVFASGPDLHSLNLSGSVQGRLDAGVQLATGKDQGVLLVPAIGYHVGGNSGQIGLSGFASYTLGGGPNYFTLGPSIYYNSGESSGFSVVPVVSAAFAILENADPAYSFGLSMRFGKTQSLVIRSLVSVIGTNPVFGLSVGILNIYPD